jgi:hypothetical protein
MRAKTVASGSPTVHGSGSPGSIDSMRAIA